MFPGVNDDQRQALRVLPPLGPLFYISIISFCALRQAGTFFFPWRTTFSFSCALCKPLRVELLIVDSYGMALRGDAEAARDVIGFYQEYLEPLRALGVAVLVIDHQSRLQAGQSYQQKGAFGSVYKANLARSVIQVEATERGEGMLTV